MSYIIDPYKFVMAGSGGCGLLAGAPTSNLQFNHVGECLVGADGSVISAWADSSAAANDLGTFAGSPVKKTNIINGLSVARANGDDTSVLSSSIAVTDFTYIAVMKVTDSGVRTLIGGNTGAPQVRLNGLKINVLKTGTADMGSSTTTLTAGTFYTIGVTYSSPNLAFYLNGSADGTASSAQTFSANLSSVLNSVVGGGENFHGDLAEHLFWTSVLSGGDLTTVFDALRTKYAHY